MLLTAASLACLCPPFSSGELAAAVPPFSEKHLEATCGTCHPLDPVRAARLSRGDWNRELEKMEAMGAKIRDRQALLNYLVEHYGRTHYGRQRANPALLKSPAQ
jgi:hypothetical protein